MAIEYTAGKTKVTLDMTKGPPARLMLRFALPMLVGNLFQQFYNIADTLIVGRFIGRDALAAVGSAFAIMSLVNSLLIGLSMGAAALFSQQFGAKDYEKLKPTICLSGCFIMGIALIIAAATFFLTDQIIILYRMPIETVAYAKDYLPCIFAGLPFVALYHFFANVLRSMGDSKSPLYFLIISCIINIALDIIFVLPLRMGVFGAALATLAAECIAAILCTAYTLRKIRFLGFQRADFRYDGDLFPAIARFSLLTGFQQSVMNLGIVLVQGLVNTFGAALMAAFAAGVKIDAFAYMPVQDFGNAFSTFAAQNTGAGEQGRVRQGFRSALLISAIFSIAVTAAVFIFARPLIGIFIDRADVEVISIGAAYLRIEGVFYVLIGFLFLLYGLYRGLGRAGMSVILTVISLGSRVLVAYTCAPVWGYTAIFWAIPVGWLLADAFGFAVWLKTGKNLGRPRSTSVG